MRRAILIPIALTALISTAVTHGQTYERIEEGVADVDPLSVGLRELEIDLRTPYGFDEVYRVPGRDDLLMRADGGLFAVFPRSVYVQSRTGLTPVIPNNTTFYIGETSIEALAAPTDDDASPAAVGAQRRDLRLDRRIAHQPIRSDVLGLRTTSALRPKPQAQMRTEGVALANAPASNPESRPVAPVEQRPSARGRSFPAGEHEVGAERKTERRSAAQPADAGAHGAAEDEAAYRSRRIRELMRRAAGAAQAARGPSSS